MIIDAGEIARGDQLSCDVCVVGSGAGGVTLALELAKAGRKVILLEGGGRKLESRTQDLYQGSVSDPDIHAPLDGDRYRQLGGTTTVWGGQCLPYDPIDFEQRDYLPYSGWPISRRDLDPYYEIAHRYCECGSFTYHVADALPDAQRDMIPGFADGEVLTSTVDRYSMPTDFGRRYRKELQAPENLRVLLHANCIEINVDENGKSVTGVTATALNRNDFQVDAGAVVLACGGLETTRLLLASNRVHSGGIGNHSDWLGRGYMGHISGDICKIVLNGNSKEFAFGYEEDPDGVYCRRRFWISEAAQRKHQILNVVCWLDTLPLYDPSHGQGVLSLAFFVKNLRSIQRRIPPEYSKILSMGTSSRKTNLAHLKNVLTDLPRTLAYYPGFAYQRYIKKPMIPSLILRSDSNMFGLHYHSEQAPNPNSRVTLGDERDELGMPRLFVDFQFTNQDIETVATAHEVIDRQLKASGCGYLKYYRPDDVRSHIREQVATGSHQLGTTRMSADPAGGVVDEHCRVHGVENLLIASSSVFPTSSQANPTLTIVALAARMAEYLNRQAETIAPTKVKAAM